MRRLAPLQRVEGVLDPSPLSPTAKVATLESSLYLRNQLLRDTDWASMAHSLEVRVPLVDPILLRSVAELTAGPANNGSHALKALIGRSPSLALPASIMQRRKTGFTTPIGQWLGRLNSVPPMNLGRGKGPGGLASRAWSRALLSQVAT
jgi:asparagine synthase (glutamine-hydrolysing)